MSRPPKLQATFFLLAFLSCLAIFPAFRSCLLGPHVQEQRGYKRHRLTTAGPPHQSITSSSYQTELDGEGLTWGPVSSAIAFKDLILRANALGDERPSHLNSGLRRRLIRPGKTSARELTEDVESPFSFDQVYLKAQDQLRGTEKKHRFNDKMKKLLDQHKSNKESIADYDRATLQLPELLKSIPPEQHGSQITTALKKAQTKLPKQKQATEKQRERLEKSIKDMSSKWETKRLREEERAFRKQSKEQAKDLQRRGSAPPGTLTLLDSEDRHSFHTLEPKADAASPKAQIDGSRLKSNIRRVQEVRSSSKPTRPKGSDYFSFRIPGRDARAGTPKLYAAKNGINKAISSEETEKNSMHEKIDARQSEHVHHREKADNPSPALGGLEVSKTAKHTQENAVNSHDLDESEEFDNIKRLAEHMRSRVGSKGKPETLHHPGKALAKEEVFSPEAVATPISLHRRSPQHTTLFGLGLPRKEKDKAREETAKTQRDDSENEDVAAMLKTETKATRDVKERSEHLHARSLQLDPQSPSDWSDVRFRRFNREGSEMLDPVQPARFIEAVHAHVGARRNFQEAQNHELEHKTGMALVFGDGRKGAEWSRLQTKQRKLWKERLRKQWALRAADGALRRARGPVEPITTHRLERRTFEVKYDGGPAAPGRSTRGAEQDAHDREHRDRFHGWQSAEVGLLASDHVQRALHDYHQTIRWAERARRRLGTLRRYMKEWQRLVPWRLRSRARVHAKRLEWYQEVNRIEAAVEAAREAEKLARERRDQAHNNRVPMHVIRQVPAEGVERYPQETIEGRRGPGGGNVLAVSRSAS